MDELYLGFDTSNYTTSIALCNADGNVIANLKRLLPVAEGQRGLRQSDAVFAHIKNLPALAEELRRTLESVGGAGRIVAAAVSATPRSAEGSYMPCFLVGEAVAECLCAALGVPLYKSSHQHGHIMAAAASASKNVSIPVDEIIMREHLALHVSGGTTDLLHVKPDGTTIFLVERIGGTADANAGQIIDRTGVRLGFRFPCGVELDQAAMAHDGKIYVGKMSVKGLTFNLSGLENKATAMINEGRSNSEVSAFVLAYIAKSVEKIILNAFEAFGRLPVVFAGGVMSAEDIRKLLGHLGYFSDPVFSTDNAAGIALIASRLHKINK